MSLSRDNEQPKIARQQSTDKIKKEPDDPMFFHPVKLFHRNRVKQPVQYNGVTDPFLRDQLDETPEEPKNSP